MPAPTQVQLWKTSDDKLHDNEEVAQRHEQFLEIVETLTTGDRGRRRRGPLIGDDHYELFMALLEEFTVTKKAD